MKHWNPTCKQTTAMIAMRRVQTRLMGDSSNAGSIDSVASAPHDRMRDSQRVMCGRIQTESQVTHAILV